MAQQVVFDFHEVKEKQKNIEISPSNKSQLVERMAKAILEFYKHERRKNNE